MDFTLEEIQAILVEMGFKTNIPDDSLKSFAKDLKRLMKHEIHVQKQKKIQDSSTLLTQQLIKTGTLCDMSVNRLASQSTKVPSKSEQELPGFFPSSASHPNLKFTSCNNGSSIKSKPLPTAVSTTAPRKASAKVPSEEVVDWKRLKTDPVRLYGWYKTHWNLHGLK